MKLLKSIKFLDSLGHGWSVESDNFENYYTIEFGEVSVYYSHFYAEPIEDIGYVLTGDEEVIYSIFVADKLYANFGGTFEESKEKLISDLDTIANLLTNY